MATTDGARGWRTTSLERLHSVACFSRTFMFGCCLMNLLFEIQYYILDIKKKKKEKKKVRNS